MEALDLAIRNLFSEFQEAVFARASIERSLKQEATFVKKTVKGKVYWYRQIYVDGQTRQTYVGPSSPALDHDVEEHRKKRLQQKSLLKKMRSDEERRSAALRRAGIPFPDAASAAVIENLSSHELIDRHGLLIGSFAFMAYAGLLGHAFEKSSLRTLDIDVLGNTNSKPTDRPLLRSSDILPKDFRPIPPLSLKQLSCQFVAPNGLRIDFLIPQRGKPRPAYRALGLADIGAQALPFLDFLIESPVRTVLLAPWGGIPILVPDPCRFAIHKLIISQRRPVTEDAKSKKDLMQAAQLITCCASERPSDLKRAFEKARSSGKKWRLALERGLSCIPKETSTLVEV